MCVCVWINNAKFLSLFSIYLNFVTWHVPYVWKSLFFSSRACKRSSTLFAISFGTWKLLCALPCWTDIHLSMPRGGNSIPSMTPTHIIKPSSKYPNRFIRPQLLSSSSSSCHLISHTDNNPQNVFCVLSDVGGKFFSAWTATPFALTPPLNTKSIISIWQTYY